MKGVQCYELFGGIALKNHAFSFSVLRVCDGFFCSMSVKNDGAVLLLLKSHQTVTVAATTGTNFINLVK